LIETASLLAHYNLTREQLVDVSILVGTDFNEGIRGIGPKKAIKLVSEYGAIENMATDIRDVVGPALSEIRNLFLRPEVTDDYAIDFTTPDREGILRFLCEEREFSRERVTAAINRAF
jgi:flap endonuclease-1